MRRAPTVVAVSLAVAAVWTAPATAAPYTTVQRTIQDCDGDNLLEFAPGEEHLFGIDAQPGNPCSEGDPGQRLRLPPTRSILNFLQLSDFQIVDEESPGRVEFLDSTQRPPGLNPFSAAYRPQESLTTQVTEAMVRQARNTVSPVTGKRLDLALLTGDNADSQQYNETRWFIDTLDGTDTGANPDPEMETPPDQDHDRKLDPNSGVPIPGCEPTPGSVYDGVRDRGESGVPDNGYYEPDSSAGQRDDGDGYSPIRSENQAETPGRDVTVRDFPGLFEAANRPFEAIGLDLPWYSAFGNHDALVQGNSPDAYFGPGGASPPNSEVFNPLFHAIVTGCVKVLQPTEATRTAVAALQQEIDALRQDIAALEEGGVTPDEEEELRAKREEVEAKTSEIDQRASQTLADACGGAPPCTSPDPDFIAGGGSVDIVPPDPRRCYLAKDDNPPPLSPGNAPGPCSTGSWIRQHFRTSGTPVGHGFAPSVPLPTGADDEYCEENPRDPDCLAASYGRPPEAVANHDGYYSFSPRPGLRFVVLDTVTDECGASVCAEGSVDDPQYRWLGEQIATAEAVGQYVMVFSHHTLRTTRQPNPDPTEQPVHYGQRLDRDNPLNPQHPSTAPTLEELFCQHRNVIAHVAGHEHENYVRRHRCSADSPPTPGPGEFVHISTAAHIDWPQQSRMIELVDVNGQMTMVLTMLDHDGPAYPGAPRPGELTRGDAGNQPPRLASIGRELAYNDYQGSRGARGGREDRNVILPLNRPPPPPSAP